MADGKDNEGSSVPPLLDAAKFIRQYEGAFPQLLPSSRVMVSDDTRPFCAEKNNIDCEKIDFNRKKRPRVSFEESVFEDPWDELGGGTTVQEAYSKIPGLCSSLVGFISQEEGKKRKQSNGYNRFYNGRIHGGRGRGNVRRGRGGRRSNSSGRGRGNRIDRADFPMAFSGRQ